MHHPGSGGSSRESISVAYATHVNPEADALKEVVESVSIMCSRPYESVHVVEKGLKSLMERLRYAVCNSDLLRVNEVAELCAYQAQRRYRARW